MRLVRVSEPRMPSSCLTGGGRAPPSTRKTSFDHLDTDLFKPIITAAAATNSSSSSSSSPSSSSSSPSSTISEAASESNNNNNNHQQQQQLTLSTKKPRTPRKRPNQTYNEAAALLSTAYPNIFSTTSLAKPPPFKFSKRVESNWGHLTSHATEEAELLLHPPPPPLLLLPQSVPKCGGGFFEPRLLASLGSSSEIDSSRNRCTTPDSQSRRESIVLEQTEEEAVQDFGFHQRRDDDDDGGGYEYDFDAESILDEEIGAGIDSIMGNQIDSYSSSTSGGNTNNNNNNNHHHQERRTTTNFCYGIPMGLGLGLPSSGGGSRFDFRLGITRGIKAFRNAGGVCGGGGGGGDQWWKGPVRTVEVEAISPRLREEGEQQVAAVVVEEKKKKKKVEEEEMIRVAVGTEGTNSSSKKKSSGGGGSSSSRKKKKVVKMKDVEEREKAAAAAAAAVAAKQAFLRPAESSGSAKRINLKLNYEDVISAWSDNGGSMFSEDPEFTGSDALAKLSQIDLFGDNGGMREASVQRYKDKRRNRLFSKKIVRYQVRKVNADQRPRVKGRFVRSPDSREEDTGGGEDKQQSS